MESLIAKTPVDFNCLGKNSMCCITCLPYIEQTFALCMDMQGSRADFFSSTEQYYSSHWSEREEEFSPKSFKSFFFLLHLWRRKSGFIN